MAIMRQYTKEPMSVELYVYGIAPEFGIWENTWNQRNMNLPAGVSCFIEPRTVELSMDRVQLVNLAIKTNVNITVGDFKLMVDAWFSPSGSGNGTSATFIPFMLEVLQ